MKKKIFFIPLPTNKEDLVLYIISAIIIVFTLAIIIREQITLSSLNKNPEYVNAAIYKLTGCGKSGRRSCLRYNYIVDGINYKSNGHWYPESDTLSVGDTIIVVYDKTNPAKNRTKRDLERKWWQNF